MLVVDVMSGPWGISRVRLLLVCAAVAILGGFGLSTCTPPPLPNETDSGAGNSKSDEQCDDLLASVLVMLQPVNLGITSSGDSAVDLLNQWQTACASQEKDSADLEPAARALLEKILSSADFQRASQRRFLDRDAIHVRNSLLFKTTIDFVVQSAEDDLDRVVQLFDYVTRNVALVEEGPEAIPLTPYEIVLFGRGTARQRAWLFANLLRQLHIDAVVLQPQIGNNQAEPKPDNRRWLVGVLLDEGVYLFDTRLGWPVPSASDKGDTATVTRPATLAEVLKDGECLKQLDVDADRPYPLRSTDLETLHVGLIGNVGYWIPRMRRLQMSLSGDRSVVISDPLDDGPTGAGLVTRVAAAGKGRWHKNDIAIWTAAEQQFQDFLELVERQDQKLLVRQHAFNAPVPIGFDQKTKQLIFGRPQRDQLKTRTMQVLGDFSAAIQKYQLIRLAGKLPVQLPIPSTIRRMHATAAQDALLWVGLCQFEQQKHRDAADTFHSYLQGYKSGTWEAHCRGLLALSLARSEQYRAAISALEASSPNDPQRHRYELFIRRWRGLLDTAASKSRKAGR